MFFLPICRDRNTGHVLWLRLEVDDDGVPEVELVQQAAYWPDVLGTVDT